jgi:hypothetical protein
MVFHMNKKNTLSRVGSGSGTGPGKSRSDQLWIPNTAGKYCDICIWEKYVLVKQYQIFQIPTSWLLQECISDTGQQSSDWPLWW